MSHTQDRADDPATRIADSSTLLLAIALGLLILLAWRLSDVLVLLFGAVILAVALGAVATPLQRRLHLSQRAAVGVTVVLSRVQRKLRPLAAHRFDAQEGRFGTVHHEWRPTHACHATDDRQRGLAGLVGAAGDHLGHHGLVDLRVSRHKRPDAAEVWLGTMPSLGLISAMCHAADLSSMPRPLAALVR